VPYAYTVPEEAPGLSAIEARNHNGDKLIGPNVLPLCECADVVFIALHGAMGENGQIQAALDVMGVKYTGTGYAGSLLAMDKDLSKKLMTLTGIATPDWLMYDKDAMTTDDVMDRIGLPCVVKPRGAGSSIGISIVRDRDSLEKAIAAAGEVEPHILIEAMVAGREFSVGVLAGKALPVIEIVPGEGFYDYKNKYQTGLTEEICPAGLSVYETETVQNLALKVHHELRLGVYSRIDFILDGTGHFTCLEANTLPGMTPTSLLPQEALAEGISYVELCARIVKAAMS
jgi:D-alanine-D-alanine ligase